jgi:hypothetical protein
MLTRVRNVLHYANRRFTRARGRAKKRYRYWHKHELGWVLVLLLLQRRDARSRVLRELADPHVEDMRAHLPGRH